MRAQSRRRFLKQAAGAAVLGLAPRRAAAQSPAPLARRFRNLQRHFIFEYYPWYGGAPDYNHWDHLGRRPPFEVGSPYLPQLGAYDVRSTAVLEQHARWIAQAGVGSIALSWWGRDSFEHRAVHGIMDVMKDHGIKVTFAMEPYEDDRSHRFRDDIVFLLREFGEKRGYDCLLLLENQDGSSGPIFKGFRCIVPREGTDCRGRTSLVADYTPDEVWRGQIERIRFDLRHDFDHVTLLADSLEFKRTPAAGFDGIGIYDNFIAPEAYAGLAGSASRAGLLFSFNVNPGYDQLEPRPAPSDPCYSARDFAPPTTPVAWVSGLERERASALSQQRIEDSFKAAVEVQEDSRLSNAAAGFFAIYINSFNEWHEGHAFEPMRNAADILPEERPFGYHNPGDGSARIETLGRLMRALMSA